MNRTDNMYTNEIIQAAKHNTKANNTCSYANNNANNNANAINENHCKRRTDEKIRASPNKRWKMTHSTATLSPPHTISDDQLVLVSTKNCHGGIHDVTHNNEKNHYVRDLSNSIFDELVSLTGVTSRKSSLLLPRQKSVMHSLSSLSLETPAKAPSNVFQLQRKPILLSSSNVECSSNAIAPSGELWNRATKYEDGDTIIANVSNHSSGKNVFQSIDCIEDDSYGYYTELEPDESLRHGSYHSPYDYNVNNNNNNKNNRHDESLNRQYRNRATTASAYAENVANLAFCAPVAPQSIWVSAEQEAELRYAQAADTVDDLLDNFF